MTYNVLNETLSNQPAIQDGILHNCETVLFTLSVSSLFSIDGFHEFIDKNVDSTRFGVTDLLSEVSWYHSAEP